MTDGQLFRYPDPGAGDRPAPATDLTRWLNPTILERLSPRWRDIYMRELERSVMNGTKPASRYCEWPLGCTELGTEWHHWAEREFFNRLAEHFPMNWYCREHHQLITNIRNASLGRR